MPPAALRIQNLCKSYDLGAEVVPVLRGIQLEVPEGDYVAIMGPSGSGKSTLLNLLGCLDKPTSGSYFLGDDDVATLDDDQLSTIRAERIGFVFQAYNLIPQLTVLENIATPLAYRGRATSADRARCRELATMVGLEHRLGHRPPQLSGGQQQRAGIARSLVNRPRFILADEATGNLDSVTTREILDLLDTLNAAGATIVMVTHEDEVARRARRIVRLRDGVIESDERHRPLGDEPTTREAAAPAAALARDSVGGTVDGSTRDSARATGPSAVGAALRTLADIGGHFHSGFKSLALHPLRSLLTVLGIFIGVASVIWLLAIGEGIGLKAQQQIAELGAKNIILRTRRPNTEQTGGARVLYGLTDDDCRMLGETLPSVKVAAAHREAAGHYLRYRDRQTIGEILGCTRHYQDLYSLELARGRFLSDADVDNVQNVCVIAAEVADKLFRHENPIGRAIHVEHDYYRVVGVIRARAKFDGVGQQMKSQDFTDNVYIPLTSFWKRVVETSMRGSGGGQMVTQVTLRLNDENDVMATGQAVREALAKSHPYEDYALTVPLELLEQARNTKLMFMAMMGLIAAISLLVGGIGIMNIMLATVTERTREIGIRRALGACRRDITRQFLVETVILSVVGGLTGILGGLTCGPLLSLLRSLLNYAMPELMATLPESVQSVSPVIVPWSIPLACGISVLIGVLFGLYPARRAAAMNPIEALRHVG